MSMAILLQKFDYNIEYESVLIEFYNFKFEEMANGSTKEKTTKLNEIVLKNTNNKIKNFFKEEELNGAVFILLSTISFDWEWENKFHEGNTKPGCFYPYPNKTSDLILKDFMSMRYDKNSIDYYDKFDGKYHFYEKKVKSGKGKEITMSFIMPIEGNSKFKDLENDFLDGDKKLFNFIRTPLAEKKTMERRSHTDDDNSLDIYLPKFELSEENDIKEMLINKGIGKVFDDKSSTPFHFKKFCDDQDIYISGFKQKIFLKVGELGVKGAAATAVVASRSGNGCSDYPNVRFDRPFIHILRYGDVIVVVGAYIGKKE